MASKDREAFERLVANVRLKLREQKAEFELPVTLRHTETKGTFTGGWCAELARLPDQGVACQLWYDRWTARDTRSLWYGFEGPVSAIVSLEQTMRPEFDEPIRLTSSDIAEGHNRLATRVRDSQLGSYFLELYKRDGYYGTYWEPAELSTGVADYLPLEMEALLPSATGRRDALSDEGFPEGRAQEQRHLRRERNSKVVREAKRRAIEEQGKLTCYVCRFDFEAVYGERGRGFIEAHHTVPVSQMSEGHVTVVGDIVLVCANCHRMLHRSRRWLTRDQLTELLVG